MLRDHQPARAETSPSPAPRPDAVQLRARRSPRLIALGVLAVVLGALGASSLYSLNTNHRSVVVMAKDVVRGEEIGVGDLEVVGIPSSLQVEMSDADTISDMVGQTARTDLPAGAFPLLRHLGEDPLPAGSSLVGLRLTSGRLPTAALPPGTWVELISLMEGDDTVVEAVVAAAPMELDDGSGHLLDVTVPDDVAATVATLAATDQLVLIAVGEG